MPLRSEAVASADYCGLSRRWLLEPNLARIVLEAEDVAARSLAADGIRWPGLYVISGHRSVSQQTEANPTQAFSLHRRCPALAVDLRVGDTPASLTAYGVWNFLGEIFKNLGAKWGGDFTSTAPDLNHFYLPGTPVA